VIDFHVHICRRGDWYPWVMEFVEGQNPGLSSLFDSIMTPDGLETYLAGEGVEKAVVLAEYSPRCTGIVTNDFVADFCRGRERLIPFCSMDPPNTADPPGLLEECVNDLGCRGLKLYPPYQHFYPNDENMYPLYEKAVELGVPVMFHTGSSVYRNSKMKYGDPLHFDELAADFPDLKIVMAHAGRGFWYDRAFFLSRLHKNVYMEVAGLPPGKLLEYFPKLEKNADKVLFGSDWPGVSGIKANADAVRGLGMREEAVEKILHGNAAWVLGL